MPLPTPDGAISVDGAPATKIAVVIPFYQREAGILARALTTVAAQRIAPAQRHIIIVDDESPIDPDSEIARLDLPADLVVTVLRQKNGGPAAARNAGIAHAEATSASHVAFLDSDDEWKPNHLATALACLGPDASFFFCDNVRYGVDGRNDLVGFDHTWPDRQQTPGMMEIADVADAYRMPPAAAFDAFFSRYLSQTSTVVFDLQTHRGARFDEALRGAGEDHLLWLGMAQDSTGVSFSTRSNVTCGLGLNLYFAAIAWSVPATRERFGYLALLYTKIIKAFDLTPEQRKEAVTRQYRALSMYGYLVFRHLSGGRFPNGKLLARLFGESPFSTARLPWLALRLASRSAPDRVAFGESVT